MNNTTYKTQKPLTAEITNSKPFYMVVRLGGKNCQQTDAMPTVRYDDELEARHEAERLAMKNPTHPRGFAVVKAIAIIKGDVTITGFNLDGYPSTLNPFYAGSGYGYGGLANTIPCDTKTTFNSSTTSEI
jgi:hypothetical protein